MTDPLRFPAADIVDLYSYRWEIELSYREMKQSPLSATDSRCVAARRTWLAKNHGAAAQARLQNMRLEKKLVWLNWLALLHTIKALPCSGVPAEAELREHGRHRVWAPSERQ